MAAIRHTLQREVFTPSDEKLLSVCYVSKAYKKKKMSFLCLITTTDTPPSLILYQVKKTDKNMFKKKQSWALSDIQVVDGVKNDSMDLELHIDKVYKWSATTIQERRTFISNLYTHSCSLAQRPQFKNIPKEWLIDPSSLKESDGITFTSGIYKINYYVVTAFQNLPSQEGSRTSALSRLRILKIREYWPVYKSATGQRKSVSTDYLRLSSPVYFLSENISVLAT